MRTTVRLPEELLKRAKRRAAAEGRTLTSLIEEGLRTVVAAPSNARTAKRRLPRVSDKTGGLMPGIDPIRMNIETEEIEDFDRLRRLEGRK